MMRRRCAGSGDRGFTLLEVVGAAALTGTVVILLLRWVLALSQISAAAIDVTGPHRDVAYINARFSADVAGATSCAPDGSQRAVVRLQGNQVRLFVDDDGDGDRDVVAWRVTGTTGSADLQRGVVERTTGVSCTAIATLEPAWATVAENVRGAQYSFSGYVDGVATASDDSPAGYVPDCLPAVALESCGFDAIGLRWVVEAPGSSMPVASERLYPLTGDLSGV